MLYVQIFIFFIILSTGKASCTVKNVAASAILGLLPIVVYDDAFSTHR